MMLFLMLSYKGGGAMRNLTTTPRLCLSSVWWALVWGGGLAKFWGKIDVSDFSFIL